MLHERLRVVGVPREEADAQRRRHVELGAGDLERLPQRRLDPRRDGLGHDGGGVSLGKGRRQLEIGEQHQELVSSGASHQVGLACRLAESLRDQDDQLVARLVPQAVVDQLEVVDIDRDDGDAQPVPASPGERELQELVEQDPVGEAGQLVVIREERDLLLGILALRDVEHHALEVERFTRGTVHDDRAVAEPQHATVAGDEPVLERERLADGASLHVRGHGSVAVIGVEMRLPQVGVLHVLRGRDPQQRFDLRTHVGGRHPFVGEIHVDDRGDVFHEGSVPRLSVHQLPLGADGVRDVEHQPEPELRVPLVVVDADGLFSDPDLPSVAVDRPVLLAERLARRHAPLAGIDDAVEVVGMQHVAPAFGRGEPFLAGQAEQIGDAGADVDHRVARR